MSAVPHSVQSQVIHGPLTMTSSVSARSLVQGLAANAYHHDDHGSGGTLVKAAYAGAGSMRPQGMGFEGPGHLLPTEDVEVFFHHLDNRPTATTVALAGFTLASVGAAANSSSESGTSFTPLTNATLSSGQTVYHNGDTVGLSGGSLITLQPPTYSDNSSYLPQCHRFWFQALRPTWCPWEDTSVPGPPEVTSLRSICSIPQPNLQPTNCGDFTHPLTPTHTRRRTPRSRQPPPSRPSTAAPTSR
ncbi:hypothetical protein C0Q70_08089 [Pomacea canaliculata]|uniref:Uncharacterized protein n=1 Tax=Pomacea canaliculata TaxID=400727 RepID=A0A2T7PGU5_POMCA|nr:hypothetical protein C0Q70_08089 [Pomacea canaliculata]